jgi:type II secretory pathway pseudopilin PulG
MRTRETGFSLIETVMVLGVMSIVGSIAVLQIGAVQPALKGDGAMRVMMAQLSTARELSITQRRQMQVEFVGTNAVRITRQEVPTGTTVLSTVPVEGGIKYSLIPGVGDTPDGFGHASAVDFGVATSIFFTSDGSLIDQSGNPLNGTVFVSIPGVARSLRAVTILGGTGRIRGYKWDGHQWVRS